MTIEDQEKIITFAKEAAERMAKEEAITTFTHSGNIVPGELFAIRWGMGEDCIKVFKISEDFEPMLFAQAIKRWK